MIAAIGVGAVVAVVAVVAANAGHPTKKPSVAAPSVNLLPPTRAPEGYPIALRTLPSSTESNPVVIVPSTKADPCPTKTTCLRTAVQPNGVVSALKEFIPAAALASVSTRLNDTFEGDEVLESRVIKSEVGSAELLIRVERYRGPTSSDPKPIGPTPAGSKSSILEIEGPGYVVDAQWIGSPTQTPPFDEITALIGDPRLETVN